VDRGVVFPAKHLVAEGTVPHRRGDGFTITQFIEANMEMFPAMHLGGPVTKSDSRFDTPYYDRVYIGLTYVALPKGHPLISSYMASATAYHEHLSRAWTAVRRALPRLPAEPQFHDQTWEWMATRDYWAKLARTASLLAALATRSAPYDPMELALAARWGEEILANEKLEHLAHFGEAAMLLKNTGVPYMRLVKQGDPSPHAPLPPTFELFAPLGNFSSVPRHHVHWEANTPGVEDVFARADTWKSRASVRLLELWGKFLRTPGAEKSATYSSIKNTVGILSAAMQKNKNR